MSLLLSAQPTNPIVQGHIDHLTIPNGKEGIENLTEKIPEIMGWGAYSDAQTDASTMPESDFASQMARNLSNNRTLCIKKIKIIHIICFLLIFQSTSFFQILL